MPVAEETGLVVAPGEWVLRQACHDAARWGGDTKIAVNVSALQFAGRHLVRTVSRCWPRPGWRRGAWNWRSPRPRCWPIRPARTRMQALRTLGIRLGLDDFWHRAFLAVVALRTYPITTLKIDRSFVVALDGGGPQADQIHAPSCSRSARRWA